jgi:hypothetical protein
MKQAGTGVAIFDFLLFLFLFCPLLIYISLWACFPSLWLLPQTQALISSHLS